MRGETKGVIELRCRVLDSLALFPIGLHLDLYRAQYQSYNAYECFSLFQRPQSFAFSFFHVAGGIMHIVRAQAQSMIPWQIESNTFLRKVNSTKHLP